MIKPHFLLILCAVIAVPGSPTCIADDWPMYGHDRTRNAVSLEKNPPLDWQIEIRDEAGKITAPAKNIKWKADLGPGGRLLSDPPSSPAGWSGYAPTTKAIAIRASPRTWAACSASTNRPEDFAGST